MRTLDIAKRLLDYGFHPPTIYFPLIVEEAMMIEPTETEPLAALDAFADAHARHRRGGRHRSRPGQGRAVHDARAPAGRGQGGARAGPALAPRRSDARTMRPAVAAASWTTRSDGAWNMAVDLALLRGLPTAAGRPTLRLYGWARPTVSLGRFQGLEGVDLEACRESGVDVVRRPTGGRGVLHDDEVTYSVAAGCDDGLPRGVGGIVRAPAARDWSRRTALLGVEATLTAAARRQPVLGAATCTRPMPT